MIFRNTDSQGLLDSSAESKRSLVASTRIPVPAKHRVDSLCELGAIRFIDTTSAYPKALQAVTPSLFSTELYFAIANLALACVIYQAFKGHLRSLSVRKYCILGNIVAKEFGKA
jgi:hypothetical protein